MKENRRKNLVELLDGPRFMGDRASFISASGMTKGRLSQLLNGEQQFGELAGKKLAQRLGLDEFYFERKNYIVHGEAGSYTKQELGNVNPTRGFSGEVPVISWVQAGSWHEAQDLFQPGDAERYLPIIRGHSANTYALKVQGDSMTSQYGKSYPAGCYIVVDPNKNMPVNGERIIAKLIGSDAVTFKVYKEEDGRRWLSPLNQTHPPIMEPFKVIGTVISKWEDE